jgi:hypothetical protein
MSPPEIAFLQSRLGGVITVAIAFVFFTITLLWAWKRPDRIATMWGGAGTALLVTIVTFIAMAAGWWQGGYTEIPLIVLLAINLPLQIAGYTLWLGWYRWLRRKTRWAWLMYGVIVFLIFIPTVVFVDPIQMQRGQFNMGGGYSIWWDTLLGQLVMWSPVVGYELARKRLVKE